MEQFEQDSFFMYKYLDPHSDPYSKYKPGSRRRNKYGIHAHQDPQRCTVHIYYSQALVTSLTLVPLVFSVVAKTETYNDSSRLKASQLVCSVISFLS